MKTTRPCYAVVVMCDGNNGEGRPIIMEGYLDLSRNEVEQRAQGLAEKYRGAMVVELPITLDFEIHPVHTIPGESKAWEVAQ